MNDSHFKRWEHYCSHHLIIIIGIILLFGVGFRLYHVTNPTLDWHAWRQADTASVSLQFAKTGVNWSQPTFLDISDTPSGHPNLQGLRLVEAPLINGVVAIIGSWLPTDCLLLSASDFENGQLSSVALSCQPNEMVLVSRVLAILVSTMGSVALWLLVRPISGKKVATVSLLVYTCAPFIAYYQRVVLPEPFLITSMLVALLGWQRWVVKPSHWWWYLVAFLSLAISYLLKPFAVFFVPVFVTLLISCTTTKSTKTIGRWIGLVMLLAGTTLPLLAWRWWISHFPEGIPGSDWLFNGNHIRLRPAWWRWIFFERIGRLMLGSVGWILLWLNAFLPISHSEFLIYGSWWLGVLAYLAILATGNVNHDYYQALLSPIIAITVGRGVLAILSQRLIITRLRWLVFLSGVGAWFVLGFLVLTGQTPTPFFPERVVFDVLVFSTAALIICVVVWLHHQIKLWARLIIIVLALATSWWLSWRYVDGYFNINHWEFAKVGQLTVLLTKPDDLIIAPYGSDTQLLYQTGRRGWPIGGAIDDKIDQGADWYLSTETNAETQSLLVRFARVPIPTALSHKSHPVQRLFPWGTPHLSEFYLLNLNQPISSATSSTTVTRSLPAD